MKHENRHTHSSRDRLDRRRFLKAAGFGVASLVLPGGWQALGAKDELKTKSKPRAFIDRLLPAPVGGGFALKDYWVWDGSVIKGEDGKYHMFGSRWPKHLIFLDGYKTYSEVILAVSDTPEGPYKFQKVVLPARGEKYWDGRITHNPTIHKYGDTYLLYYIGSTYKGPAPSAEELRSGKSKKPREMYANLRIGLATSKSLSGPWQRRDEPVLSPRTRPKWDFLYVTNPAACVRDDGSILLVYRSKGLRLGAVMSSHYAQPFRRITDGPVLKLKDKYRVEDPYLWWNGKHFELVAKDITGGLCGEKYAGIHATSSEGTSWKLSEPPMAYSRRVRWADGTETVQGCLERPQLLFDDDGQPTHLFAATGDGPGGFDNSTKTWTMVIPLKKA